MNLEQREPPAVVFSLIPPPLFFALSGWIYSPTAGRKPEEKEKKY